MADLSLIFDILARDQASKTFRQVGDEAERTGRRAESGLGTIVGAAKVAGAAIVGAGIITGFRELYDAAAESARIGRLTESTIAATGSAARVTADDVSELAGAISGKTGIDDEAIQSGQNLLLTFKNIRNEAGDGNNIFDQTSQIMADMSTVMGTDASGSAIQLGKALNDPIRGIGSLARAGVQFTEQQKDQIRTLVESGDTLGAQKIILAELTAQFGGAAEAAATPLDRMQVSVGNVAETVGAYLIPVVDRFAAGAVTAIEGVSEGFESGAVTADGFEGTMQGVGVVVADVADGVGALVDVGQVFLGVLDAIPGPVLIGVGAMAGFAALRGPVGDALDTIALKALYARDGLSAAGGGMGVLKGGASGLVGVLGGPWGIAIGAATIGLGFLVDGLSDSSDASGAAAAAQQTFASAVEQTNGAIDESVRAAAAKAAQDKDLLDIAADAGISLSRVTDAALGNGAAYDEITAAMERYVQTRLNAVEGNTEDAGFVAALDAQNRFRDGLDELAPTVDDVRQRQEALGTATEGTSAALGAAVPSADDFTAAMEANQQATADAKKEVDGYKLALDILTGANVSLVEVQSAFYDSLTINYKQLAEMEGAVADATGGLNQQSEAGRYAQDVLLGVRDSGNQLIATMVQQGATAEDVAAQDAALRNSFIDTANEMGFTREQAGLLADEYLGIPSERLTTVTADTGQASGALTSLFGQINQVAQNRVASIQFRASLSDIIGNLNPFSEGGYTGPGGRLQPAGIVHAGEVVWSQDDIAAHGGVQQVESMRRARRGYADGGVVTLVGTADTSGASASIGKVFDDFVDAANASARTAVEPATGMARGLAYARSQVGKPYLWGSAGPAGFDCSGFMAAITNVVRGASPNTRLGSTATFPWSGFASGAGMFTIGSTPNAGGGIGHMAGTILGVNVESRGGQGVVVGPSARGAANGLFTERAHLATYDAGGLLQPGYTLAYNGTGKAERIRTAEQEESLTAAPRTVIHDNRQVYATVNARELSAAMRQDQIDLELVHGG